MGIPAHIPMNMTILHYSNPWYLLISDIPLIFAQYKSHVCQKITYIYIYIYAYNTYPCWFIYSHCLWDSCFMGIPMNPIRHLPCADPAERSVWCHAPHGPWNPGRHWWSWMNGGPAPVDRWLSPLFIGCHPRWCRNSSIHSMWIG